MKAKQKTSSKLTGDPHALKAIADFRRHIRGHEIRGAVIIVEIEDRFITTKGGLLGYATIGKLHHVGVDIMRHLDAAGMKLK